LISGQGYDWHGPSTLDVWASHDALRSLISSRDEWRAWSIDESKVILLGHSNGGQGVWYQASRFPDRVLAGKDLELDCIFLFHVNF
jgi:pimeloyl-ACP methyl ester carboxylesterase